MKKKKILLVAIGMVLTFTCGITAKANENIENNISPYYVYIQNVGYTFNISNAGSATCKGQVVVKTGKTCKVEVKLQKKSGGTWRDVKTWNKSGTSTCSAGGTYVLSKGYSYRLRVKAVCDSETKIENTPEKNY